MKNTIMFTVLIIISSIQLSFAENTELPGLTPLMRAAINNDLGAIESLINSGNNIEENYRGYSDPMSPYFYYYKYTALFFALEAKHEDAAKLLIDKGANFHARAYQACYDYNNGTCDSVMGGDPVVPISPFELGLIKRLQIVSRYFLEHGEKVSMKWIDEFLEDKEITFLKLFFEFGLDVNSIVEDGSYSNSRLAHVAARANQADVLALLNEKGADWELKNKSFNTPLLSAVKSKIYADRSVSFLVSLPINLNAQDSDGMTALMIASKNLREEFVKLLVDAKASKNLKNNSGQNAIQLADCKYTVCTKETKEIAVRIKNYLRSF